MKFRQSVAFKAPDELVEIARGATGSVHHPFAHTAGPNAGLEEKLDVMRRFGDDVIRPSSAC